MCVQVCLSRLLDFEWISEQEPPTITVLRTQQQPRACKAKRNLNVRSKICKIFRNMSVILSNDARATPLTITSRKKTMVITVIRRNNKLNLVDIMKKMVSDAWGLSSTLLHFFLVGKPAHRSNQNLDTLVSMHVSTRLKWCVSDWSKTVRKSEQCVAERSRGTCLLYCNIN